jgi:hypothetical protein
VAGDQEPLDPVGRIPRVGERLGDRVGMGGLVEIRAVDRLATGTGAQRGDRERDLEIALVGTAERDGAPRLLSSTTCTPPGATASSGVQPRSTALPVGSTGRSDLPS